MLLAAGGAEAAAVGGGEFAALLKFDGRLRLVDAELADAVALFQDGIACGVDGQLPFVVRAAITPTEFACRMPQRLNVELRGAVRAS